MELPEDWVVSRREFILTSCLAPLELLDEDGKDHDEDAVSVEDEGGADRLDPDDLESDVPEVAPADEMLPVELAELAGGRRKAEAKKLLS